MKRLTWWRVLALMLVLVLSLVGAGCGDDDDDGGSSGDVATLETGKLKVGSDIPYAPLEFGEAPYKGFDVDVVNEIGKRLDLDVEFVKTPFDPIFRNLAQGRFDMVASAATITPERKKQVDFSFPYFPADQSLMVKRGSDIQSTKDLAGKTVGGQLGTTGAAYAKDETDAKEVRTYDLVDDAFNALQNGQVEAVINDFPISKYAERSKKDLVVVQQIPTGEQYGLGFKKGNDNLRNAVNEQIDKMKADGTYADIYRKWFEVDPPESILKPGTAGSDASGTEPVE
jgi:polar amino acid transport system substrate-binding protein